MWDCESAFAGTVLFLLKSCQVQRPFTGPRLPGIRQPLYICLLWIWMMAVLHFPLNTGLTDIQCWNQLLNASDKSPKPVAFWTGHLPATLKGQRQVSTSWECKSKKRLKITIPPTSFVQQHFTSPPHGWNVLSCTSYSFFLFLFKINWRSTKTLGVSGGSDRPGIFLGSSVNRFYKVGLWRKWIGIPDLWQKEM